MSRRWMRPIIAGSARGVHGSQARTGGKETCPVARAAAGEAARPIGVDERETQEWPDKLMRPSIAYHCTVTWVARHFPVLSSGSARQVRSRPDFDGPDLALCSRKPPFVRSGANGRALYLRTVVPVADGAAPASCAQQNRLWRQHKHLGLAGYQAYPRRVRRILQRHRGDACCRHSLQQHGECSRQMP